MVGYPPVDEADLLVFIRSFAPCAGCSFGALIPMGKPPALPGRRGNLGFGADSNGKVQGFTLCFYGNNGQCGLPIEPPMAEINWA